MGGKSNLIHHAPSDLHSKSLPAFDDSIEFKLEATTMTKRFLCRISAFFRHLFDIRNPSTQAISSEISELLSTRSLFDACTGLGYSVSAHSVSTADAYSLTVFRLWNPSIQVEHLPTSSISSFSTLSSSSRPAVILWHGFSDSYLTWIANGPAKSLAFLLADAGFDVFLPNNRGNAFSCKHTYLNAGRDSLYWRFSALDAAAKYDVSAVLEFVAQLTGEGRVALVTHSEGSAHALAALAQCPELADRLSCLVALGPVGIMGTGVQSPSEKQPQQPSNEPDTVNMLSSTPSPSSTLAELAASQVRCASPLLTTLAWLNAPHWMIRLVGFDRVIRQLPKCSLIRELHIWLSYLLPESIIRDDFMSMLLGPFHGQTSFASASSFSSSSLSSPSFSFRRGGNHHQWDDFDGEPGAISMLSLLHYTQLIRHNAAAASSASSPLSPESLSSPEMRMCDFGAHENQILYQQRREPPRYDLSRIPASLPKAFFFGGRDQLVSLPDLALLIQRLKLNASLHQSMMSSQSYPNLTSSPSISSSSSSSPTLTSSPSPLALVPGEGAECIFKSPSRRQNQQQSFYSHSQNRSKTHRSQHSPLLSPTSTCSTARTQPTVAELLVAEIPSFTHTDYLWHEEAYTILYPKLVSFLSRYSQIEY